MIPKFATVAGMAALGCALPAIVLAQGAAGQAILPSQTVITGTLEHDVNTKTAQPTDQFVLDVQPPYPADDQRLNGARIIGHIVTDNRASGMSKGTVTLAFDRLILADGTEATIGGTTLSTQGQKAGNTTSRAVVGAVLGDVVGNYIGKHIGTDLGGLVGAAGGAYAGATLGTNVTLPQGSKIELRTTQAAVITGRRQAAGRSTNQQPSYDNAAPSYGHRDDQTPQQPEQPVPQPSPTI